MYFLIHCYNNPKGKYIFHCFLFNDLNNLEIQFHGYEQFT